MPSSGPSKPAARITAVRLKPDPNWVGGSSARSTYSKAATIRSAACPSPYGFGAWLILAYALASVSRRWPSAKIRSGSVPTSSSVPASMPSERSVCSRVTSTGLPSAGASSWMPPESVITRSQRPSSFANGA